MDSSGVFNERLLYGVLHGSDAWSGYDRDFRAAFGPKEKAVLSVSPRLFVLYPQYILCRGISVDPAVICVSDGGCFERIIAICKINV